MGKTLIKLFHTPTSAIVAAIGVATAGLLAVHPDINVSPPVVRILIAALSAAVFDVLYAAKKLFMKRSGVRERHEEVRAFLIIAVVVYGSLAALAFTILRGPMVQ